jgi:hypothetical protein
MHLGPPSDILSSYLPIGIAYNFSYFKCMLWEGHILRVREKRHAYRILAGKSEGREPLICLDVGGSIILSHD